LPPLCERCGAPTVWPVVRCGECAGRRLSFHSARAAVAYDDAVKTLISGWKERGLRKLAGPAGEIVAERLPRPEADAIAFVPPDGDRRLERGHHPAEALASELARCWEIPVLPLITRARALPRQRGLSLTDRRKNVRDAFRPTRAAPPSVCLVDDVYTSGATADAAAKALKQAGGRQIWVITFARAVR
jgi:predicted amidophosphoribosyltransferase